MAALASFPHDNPQSPPVKQRTFKKRKHIRAPTYTNTFSLSQCTNLAAREISVGLLRVSRARLFVRVRADALESMHALRVSRI